LRRIDASQKRIGVDFENCKLVVEGGVEHRVGVYLKREYVFLFSRLNARPHRNRFGGAFAAELRVAHDSADETVVARRNAVMVVEVQLRERGQVDFKFEFVRNARGQFIV